MKDTKITWCDSTRNFWSGCSKVSPACAHCYAETMAKRFPHFGKWGDGKPRAWHGDAAAKDKSKWRWVDETDAGHPVLYDAELGGHDVPPGIARNVLGYHLRPSIFLPKVHWRTFCELTQVRTERLQDISEADCLAEGIHKAIDGAFYGVQYFIGYNDAAGAYAELWDSINGKGSFDANQFVWALTYNYLP